MTAMKTATMIHNMGLPMRHFLLAMFLSVALIGCSDNGTPQKQSAADVAAGKVVADRECKGCHGLDGKGAAAGIPNLAGQRGRYTMAALKEYKDGVRTHMALRQIATNMGEDETRQVATFYASLTPIQSPKAPQFSAYENGKAVAATCANCHGADGNSKTPGTPSLAGQQPQYFVVATQEYLTGARQSAPMDPMLRRMSKLDVESAALFFASQTPAQRSAPSTGNAAAGEPRTAVCGGCHGSHGVSTDSATPSLAGQDPQYLKNAILAYRTTRKHALMSRLVADLSDQDIDNIVAFYVTQKSKPAESGETLLKEITTKCDRCHSGDRDNPALAIPIIAGQDKDYLTLALRAYRDGKRGNSMMHNMSLPYSDSIIESIASYYASQPAK
jgi:cytochrome c553